MAYINPYYNQPMQYQQTQPMQIQNGGFVSVRSENEARTWPVAPGNSVTFKDENAPYVYTKTMGFSQLDRPIFEKYRLVKEEPEQNMPQEAASERMSDFALKSDLRTLMDAYDSVRRDLDELKKEIFPFNKDEKSVKEAEEYDY